LWQTWEMAAPLPTEKTLRRDAKRNRERIVASARTLFAERGIEVSVEEITRRAGVGMGTLYRHFPAKEDLADAVLEEAFEAYLGLAQRALAEEDAWTGFTTFLEQALAVHAGNRGLMDVVAMSVHGRSRAQAVRERIRPLLRQLVERAQAQGALRSDVTAEDVPAVFWAVGRVIEATENVAPDHWRRHLGIVLDGLRARSATSLHGPPLTQAQLARTAKRDG
jgi:AcrR family transcriptional regulator